VGLGLPFNIASYGFLLEMISKQCNMVPGKLLGDLTNVHIYKNHTETLREQLKNEPHKLPKLVLANVANVFSYTYGDFVINDYKSHPPMKMSISV
jgi:thymidylate synthase